jgi:hypothetical protein
MKVTHHLGILSVDGRTILKWILNKKVMEMLAGLIYLGVRTSEVLF